MKTVIYNTNLEPITVIELDFKYIEMMRKGLQVSVKARNAGIVKLELYKLLEYNNIEGDLVIALDEERALLLPSVKLPGQK